MLLVLCLAPVTAEYLIGYDDTLTNPAALIFGVLLFGPIYGAPAVLIREIVRRRQRGWASILLLAAAFGLIQAGLVDQSLFDPDYRDIPYWQSMREPTYLPWAGSSAYMVLTFVAGHVFGSIAAPIAAAESWWPRRRDEPWLGRAGLTMIAGLWAFGAWFILRDQFGTTSFRISPGQFAGTVVAVAILVVLALWGKGPTLRPSGRPAPPWWVVALVTAVLLAVRSLVPSNWTGTLLAVAAITVWVVLMVAWSRAPGWSGVHVVGAFIGDMFSIGGPAFATAPLGDPALASKLLANTALLALVLGVAAIGFRRERQAAQAG